MDAEGKNLDFDRPWPQNALLVVDRATGALKVTAAYYVFRHLSYFVDPGAVRVATAGGSDALAFENPDGSVVTVVYNDAAQARATTLGIGDTRLQFEVPTAGRRFTGSFDDGTASSSRPARGGRCFAPPQGAIRVRTWRWPGQAALSHFEFVAGNG